MIKSTSNHIRPIYGFDPGLNSSTERQSDWVSLKNYNGVIPIYMGEADNAARDTTVRLQQASSRTGTGVKNLIPDRWYRQTGTDITSDDNDEIAVVAGAAAGCSVEGADEQIIWCEIDAAELDIAGGFEWVRMVVDDVANGEKLQASCMLMVGAKHATDPEHLASATNA